MGRSGEVGSGLSEKALGLQRALVAKNENDPLSRLGFTALESISDFSSISKPLDMLWDIETYLKISICL